MELAQATYSITKELPDSERFGLSSQMCPSSVSVVSNIAEGAGRNSTKEFRNLLGIANGCLNELNTQIELSLRLKFITQEHCERLQEL